jgi:hypothetical protein
VGQPISEFEAQGGIIRPLTFVGIAPCRIVDTRGNGFVGAYGPPALTAGVPRSFTLTGQCGIPGDAGAVSLNVTVTNTLGPGHIVIFPQGGAQPTVSTLNYVAGQTVANAAIVPLGAGGITVVAGVSGTDLIIDTNGYYGEDVPDVTRSVHIPLLSLIGCTGGTAALLDTTSGADAIPDFSYSAPDQGIRISFDVDPGFPDQNSRICSEFVVPPDYASGGRFRVVADKGGSSGATEVLNCSAGINIVAMGAAGTVELASVSPEQYACTPTLPALTPGQRVHFGLSITSSGTMDNGVLLLGVEFEYTASQ